MKSQTTYFSSSSNKNISSSQQRSNSKNKDNVSPVKGIATTSGNGGSNQNTARKSPGQVQLSLKSEEYSTPIKGTLPGSTTSQSQNSYTNFDAINPNSTTNSTNRGKAQVLSSKSPLKSVSIAKTGVVNLQKDGSKSELNISQYEKKNASNINLNGQRIDQDGNELTTSQKYTQEFSGIQGQGDGGSQILDISSNQIREEKEKKGAPQKSYNKLDDSPTGSRKISISKNATPNLVPLNSSGSSYVPGQKRESATFSLAKNILKRQNTNQTGGLVSDKANLSMDKGSLNLSTQQSNKPKYATNSNNAAAYNPEVTAKEKDGNVRVYARFRPNNAVELDLINQGLGSNVITFNDDKSVSTNCDNQMYTFDRTFKPDSKQENVYKTVAVEVINDVLAGYNGTIFTYGVTGSGKTHTMFGKIQEDEMEGIIPRMCTQLFEHVNNEELDIDYTINVSMLEIYKENLFDSLIMLNAGEKKELKIKEHPQKGIIVDGLTAKQIGKEEELFGIIDYGYNSRQTRATRLNEYSSRSHTVFMVEIVQKLPNGSEKSGKLNLIDLAGSEKVNKSGAVGESLEEAIKINVSLTCLGKVIHALTSGQEYIPYRDSKLTRILQESLGGNYKTSLIVCCSMHSNFQDDTISTLKFATRAKTIKNTFKVNIKSSPESMKQAIELLKQEVFQTKNLLQIFHSNIADVKEGLEGGGSQDPDKMKKIKQALDRLLEYQTDYNPKQYELSALTDAAGRISALGAGAGGIGGVNGYAATGNASVDILIARVKNRDEEISTLKNTIVDMEEKTKGLENDLLEIKKSNIKMMSEINDLKIEKNSINVKFNKEVSKNDFLVFQIEILQKQIQNLVDQVCKSEKRCAEYLSQKKKAVDEKIDNIMKDDLTFAEIKLADYFSNSINFNYEIQIDRNSGLNQNINLSSLNGNKKSIHSSVDSSSDSDSDSNSSFISSSVQTPLSKQPKTPSQFSGKKVDGLPQPGGKPLLGIPNTSSFYKGQNQQSLQPPSSNRDDGMKDSFLNNVNFNNISNNPNVEMLKKIIEIPQMIDEASQKDPVSKDFMIINLKKCLINAHIINQNLLRTISALEWKQIIEYGKSQLKSNVIKIQGKHIQNLESVIDENAGNQKHLREKMEEIEFEINMQQKEIKTTTSMSRLMPRKSRIMLPVPVQPRFQHTVQTIQKMKQISPQRKDSISSESSKKESKLLNNTNSSQIRNNTDKPESEDLIEIMDMIDKNVLPLTYENAIMELKKKNAILKRLYQENNEKQTMIMPTVVQDTDKLNAFMSENERLRDKIITIQSELEMEQAKTQSYKGALNVERKNLNNLRKLNQEMEISLRNNLREENEGWQSVINTIKEQNEKEMIKRQQDYNILNEKLNDVLEKSMYKLNDMKTRGQTVTIVEIEQVIQELQKQKNSVSVNYENKSAKRRSLLFTPGMLPGLTPGMGVNPHSPHAQALLQTFAQQAQQNAQS